VPKKLFKPPLNIVKEWPEVFEDMYMNTMPVAYLHIVKLEFNNGRIWELRIPDLVKESDSDTVADKLVEMFQEYHDDIKNINFEIDIEKLKKDIAKETKKFL
jgi:hypothetical protein